MKIFEFFRVNLLFLRVKITKIRVNTENYFTRIFSYKFSMRNYAQVDTNFCSRKYA